MQHIQRRTRLHTLCISLAVFFSLSGFFCVAGAEENLTAGELLKAALKAEKLDQTDNAIDYLYRYLDVVEESRAVRVVIIAQDCRLRLSGFLIEMDRLEEAAPILCSYLKLNYVNKPRKAMKMLATCYYESGRWYECTDVVSRALEYNTYPAPPKTEQQTDSKGNETYTHTPPQEDSYTASEIAELEKLREEAQLKVAQSGATEPSRTIESQHDFFLKPAKASPGLLNLLGETFYDANQTVVSPHVMADKVVGIYFAAEWKSPCLFFTPKLVTFHQEMNAAGKAFEVVFVSVDRSPTAMQAFMEKADMPWLALPYESDRRKALADTYGIHKIPALVIVDHEGVLITKDGQKDVQSRRAEAFDHWTKK